MRFIDAMEDLAAQVRGLGHRVELPQREEKKIDWESSDIQSTGRLKKRFIDDHLEKIRTSDAVLLANFEKHGVQGYVGPNTLMEAAFAYALNKPVVLLFEPGDQSCSLELRGISSLVLDGAVENIEEVWLQYERR